MIYQRALNRNVQVGGVIVEKYSTPADMKQFEICLRVDVIMDKVSLKRNVSCHHR